MKKVLDGKLYSTETAQCLASYSYALTDRAYRVEEDLYQKENGEFFLHGAGGPLSRYAHHFANGDSIGSERIIPMTGNEARRWCETHCDVDLYEKIFGPAAE